MNQVRTVVSNLLMLIGLAFAGLGVFYWWKGWPYAAVVLRICCGYGSLVLGAGALVRPGSATISLVSAVSFAISSALLFGLWLTTPWATTLYLTSAILSGGGAIAAVVLLLFRRKRRGPSRG